jgi:hypothetical protein
MATNSGRKSAFKKKEEVAESPKKEVIEPKVEEPKEAAPEKAVEKVASEPVQEELPPQPPEPAPVVEPVAEPVIKTVVEEVAVQAVTPAPRVVEIGSLVIMPSGKRGTVISINRKGYFEVKCERNPGKTYLYESSQLKLV